jgi:hypothetical protein
MQHKNGLAEMSKQVKQGLACRRSQLPIWQASGMLDKALFIIASEHIAEFQAQRFWNQFQNRIGGEKCQSTFV